MPDHDELLERFQPVLRYDSNEQFFADSAEQYAVNPGNELRRKRTEAGNGAVLASAQPKSGEQQLTLGFLGREKYADGRRCRRATSSASPARTTASSTAGCASHTPSSATSCTATRSRPTTASGCSTGCSTSTTTTSCRSASARTRATGRSSSTATTPRPTRPTSRSTRSIASESCAAGTRSRSTRPTPTGRSSTSPAARMPRTSRRAFTRPRGGTTSRTASARAPRLRLEIVSDDTHPWLLWPGRWGDTLPRKKGIETDSPTGPGKKNHWRQPDKLLDNKPSIQVHGKGRGAAGGAHQARRRPAALRVRRHQARAPSSLLVVTVNSKDEEGVPPRTHNIEVHASGHGKVTTELVLDPLKHYDVHTSMVADDPPKPSESALSLVTPFHESVLELDFGRRVLRFLSQTSGGCAAIAAARRGRSSNPAAPPPLVPPRRRRVRSSPRRGR